MNVRAEVILRRDSVGGEIANPARFTGSALRTRGRLIALIHGYNNSENDADSAFDAFERGVAEIDSSIAKDFVRVHWPGDLRVPLVRPAVYPWRVHTAIACAESLAQYVRERRSPSGSPYELVIVAHSLGCRLALETLNCLQRVGAVPDRITVILLAAAVPVELVEALGALSVAVTSAHSTLVIYSLSDSVLKYAFPIGQRLAEPGLLQPQQAVGLWGRPVLRTWSERHGAPQHAHGDYWGSSLVHEIFCRELGVKVPRRMPIRSFSSLCRPLAREHPARSPRGAG